MVTIEGNTSRVVARRTYAYNDWRVAGFARPEYSASVDKKISVVEIAGEVVAGKWGNGDERVRRLKSAGYDIGAVQKEVNRLVQKKSNQEVAKEVACGQWGNGDARRKRLRAAEYDYDAVQRLVNGMV